MDINYTSVLLATVAQFIIGAIWYMPLFGNAWRDIHGFGKLSKKDQQQAQKDMMPMLFVQLIITGVTSLVLARLLVLLPNYSAYTLAGMVWIGFFVPVQVAGIMFGGTDKKWMIKKALIMASGSLACLMAAAAILK